MSTEIITDSEYAAVQLREHAESINDAINTIVQFEDSFKENTLEPCLLIGRETTKAQALFGLSPQDRTIPATLSRAVTTLSGQPNSLGFSSWLAREIPRLKRPTAIKYATCFKALGLPDDAQETRITAKIKDLRHECGKENLPMPSLASLYKQGKPAKQPLRLADPDDSTVSKSGKQLRLEDAREFWHGWREKASAAIDRGILDDLDKKGLEEMKEFQGWLRDRINNRLRTL